MHIHILGICGTFMGGLAILAKALGHKVTGSDQNVYPPMSTQLQQQGIELISGYDPQQLELKPDLVVIGNALSRGNPVVEAILAQKHPYISGPQWLSQALLQQRWVIAVAGTHGKTTTASMVAWILEYAGHNPGFLIGGIPHNFGLSARLGQSPYFVIEADEYDTAFFDKRSKFVHYQAKTSILNNLEFDHADIFANLAEIEKQFHHFVRIIPENGCIIRPHIDPNLDNVLKQGHWSPVITTAIQSNQANNANTDWTAKLNTPAGNEFSVYYQQQLVSTVNWSLTGHHNINNALAAIAACQHAGINPETAIQALSQFQSVKRRLEKLATINNISIYDDFAHHPTAIATTLQGLRHQYPKQRIIAVLEPRSNTMQMGIHQQSLAPSLALADQVLLYQSPNLSWSFSNTLDQYQNPTHVYHNIDDIITALVKLAQPQDQIVIMSNGGFANIHQRLIQAFNAYYAD